MLHKTTCKLFFCLLDSSIFPWMNRQFFLQFACLKLTFVLGFNCTFTFAASYPIVRNRGRFGNVSVAWVLEPGTSGDVRPVEGYIEFSEGEYLKNLTLFSEPDEVILSLSPTPTHTHINMQKYSIWDISMWDRFWFCCFKRNSKRTLLLSQGSRGHGTLYCYSAVCIWWCSSRKQSECNLTDL